MSENKSSAPDIKAQTSPRPSSQLPRISSNVGSGSLSANILIHSYLHRQLVASVQFGIGARRRRKAMPPCAGSKIGFAIVPGCALIYCIGAAILQLLYDFSQLDYFGHELFAFFDPLIGSDFKIGTANIR